MPVYSVGVLIMPGPFLVGRALREMLDVVTWPDLAGAVPIAGHSHQPPVFAGAAGTYYRPAAVAGVPDYSWRSRRAAEPGRGQFAALPAVAAGAAGGGRDGLCQGHCRRLLGHRRRTGVVVGAIHGLRRGADAAPDQTPRPSRRRPMILDWQGALDSVIHHPLFGIGITLGAYQLVLAAFEKTRWIFLQPVLVSMVLVIGVLVGCGLTYAEYRKSTEILSILLGPATVALAVPLYLNLRRIRQLFWPIFTTLVIGGVVATGLGVLLGWWFGAEHMILMTMAPKSVTSPIAMLVAEQIGGVAALAAVFVLITGVIGAIFGPSLLTRLGVHSPEARGMALGMTAHAVGTSVALQESEECGAFAALAMSLMGVATAVFLPLAVSMVV